MYHNFFIHSSVDGHLGYFHVIFKINTNMTSVLPPVLSVIWSIFSAPVILSLLFESMNCGKLACKHSSVQFSSVAQSCPTLCDPMNCSMPDLPVHHQLPEFTQTYVHQVGDAIHPSHLLSSPSPPAPNPFQHQSFFQVNSSHEVAKVLEFQL